MPKISKTQINKRKKRKTNLELVETIELARKNNLLELGKRLSGPKRLYKKINLNALNKLKEEKVIVVGKVLSKGEVNKKMKVAALGFSADAISLTGAASGFSATAWRKNSLLFFPPIVTTTEDPWALAEKRTSGFKPTRKRLTTLPACLNWVVAIRPMCRLSTF